MRRNRVFTTGLVACHLVVFTLTGFAEAGTEKETARTILDAAGIRTGLVVQIGCGDGRLTGELARNPGILVHGSCLDPAEAGKVRQHLRSLGVYGKASVDYRPLGKLPYPDHFANIVVVEDFPRARETGLTVSEVMRIACPRGTVFLGMGRGWKGAASSKSVLRRELTSAGIRDSEFVSKHGLWTRITNPWPEGMDEWTHERYDASGNAVSRERISDWFGTLQWIAGPAWDASCEAVVTGNGRIFYHLKAAKVPFSRVSKLIIMARDAFNGTLLWTREWEGELERAERVPYRALRGEKPEWSGKKARYSSAVSYTRPGGHRLPLASGKDLVYTVFEGKAVAFDAATGRRVYTFGISGDPREIVLVADTAYVVSSDQMGAYDAATGRLRWKKDLALKHVVVDEEALYCLGTDPAVQAIMSLDPRSGKERWKRENPPWKEDLPQTKPPANFMQLRFCRAGLLVVTGGKGVYAVSTKDGSALWSRKHLFRFTKFRYGAYSAAYYWDDLVWLFNWDRDSNGWKGYDPRTGELKKGMRMWDFQGCSRAVFTSRLLLAGGEGLRLDTQERLHTEAVRGACNLGTLGANGLTYGLQVHCTCRTTFLLGLSAHAPKSTAPAGSDVRRPRLERGPGYGRKRRRKPAPVSGNEWRTYRHDGGRSNATSSELPNTLGMIWECKLEEPAHGTLTEDWGYNDVWSTVITAPTVADGKVFVALPDRHRVVAVDIRSGKPLWQFTAGGRVLAPPTLYNGHCLFGSQDGWIYCVGIEDGQLEWRFRAREEDELMMAHGQVESKWPVLGVVVAGDTVYAASGRTSGGDGGIHLCALNPATGERVFETAAEKYKGLVDLLSADEEKFLHFPTIPTWEFDLKQRKECPDGKVSPERLKRRFSNRLAGGRQTGGSRLSLLHGTWLKYRSAHGKRSGWHYGGATGHLLAFNDRYVCGLNMGSGRNIRPSLFSQAIGKPKPSWKERIKLPAVMQALILAGEKMVVGGMMNVKTQQDGQVWVISASDGKHLQEIKLDTHPVYEGMAAASGRLYVSMADGRVLCYGKGAR